MQVRVPDPTGANTGGIWVDPMRDLAHNFPYHVRRALLAVEDEIKQLPDEERQAMTDIMSTYGAVLGQFVKGCIGPESPDTVVKLFKKIKFLDMPDVAHRMFGKWFARVALGVYYMGIRAAMHPGEKPLGVDTLMKTLEELEGGNKDG